MPIHCLNAMVGITRGSIISFEKSNINCYLKKQGIAAELTDEVFHESVQSDTVCACILCFQLVYSSSAEGCISTGGVHY